MLPVIAPGLAAPQSVRSNRGELDLVETGPDALAAAVTDAVRHATTTPGSVGVIAVPGALDDIAEALAHAGIGFGRLGADHGDDADHQVELVPAQVAKGLEFDRVIVVEPADIADAEPDEATGLRRLYVVLTRAVSALSVVHARPIPAPLTS